MSKIMPHLVIIISCMLLVFLIIDHFNTAMNFINNDLTKGLMTAQSVLAVLCCIMLIARQRRDG